MDHRDSHTHTYKKLKKKITSGWLTDHRSPPHRVRTDAVPQSPSIGFYFRAFLSNTVMKPAGVAHVSVSLRLCLQFAHVQRRGKCYSCCFPQSVCVLVHSGHKRPTRARWRKKSELSCGKSRPVGHQPFGKTKK